MTEENVQAMLTKLESELKTLRDAHPQQYLELLKILNQGIEDITAKLEKIVKRTS